MDHSLAGNLGKRWIEASRLILERQLAGNAVEGSRMGAGMDWVELMQRHKRQGAIGKSCCRNGCVEVEGELDLEVGTSYWSFSTLERLRVEEKFGLEQERFRSSNSCILP
jgi:hypothetical protein